MLKKTDQLFLTLCIAGCLVSCSSKEISERVAMNEITYFIDQHPVYETADLAYGEVKFSKKKDATQLAAYQKLQQEGYITMELLEQNKKFLSKDSTFEYLIELTDKAIPFVVEKTDKKATVKTYQFALDEDQPIQLEKSGKTRAKATVTLSRQETSFTPFAKTSKGANATFSKKTYTLKFQDESGWKVSK